MLGANGERGLGLIYGGRVLAGMGVGGASNLVPICKFPHYITSCNIVQITELHRHLRNLATSHQRQTRRPVRIRLANRRPRRILDQLRPHRNPSPFPQTMDHPLRRPTHPRRPPLHGLLRVQRESPMASIEGQTLSGSQEPLVDPQSARRRHVHARGDLGMRSGSRVPALERWIGILATVQDAGERSKGHVSLLPRRSSLLLAEHLWY